MNAWLNYFVSLFFSLLPVIVFLGLFLLLFSRHVKRAKLIQTEAIALERRVVALAEESLITLKAILSQLQQQQSREPNPALDPHVLDTAPATEEGPNQTVQPTPLCVTAPALASLEKPGAAPQRLVADLGVRRQNPSLSTMSQWRREATERIPELQSIIASESVDSPMRLWIELNQAFGNLCEQQPPPSDLLRRIWGYCKWCLAHRSDHVQTSAALGFCEHLIDTPARERVLPTIMNRDEFLGFRDLLEYHNNPERVDACIQSGWK